MSTTTQSVRSSGITRGSLTFIIRRNFKFYKRPWHKSPIHTIEKFQFPIYIYCNSLSSLVAANWCQTDLVIDQDVQLNLNTEPQTYIESIFREQCFEGFFQRKVNRKDIALVALPDPHHSPGTDFVY